MVSFKLILYFKSGPSRLGFQINIIAIHTWIAIRFVNNIKVTLKPIKLTS